jgi:acetyltransferase-like isoleucine patch superfamily enzyme
VKRGASIGSNATIIAGVIIGDYAVVGAGATVVRDVEPYSIYAGNPARKLKQFKSGEELHAYMRSRQPEKGVP